MIENNKKEFILEKNINTLIDDMPIAKSIDEDIMNVKKTEEFLNIDNEKIYEPIIDSNEEAMEANLSINEDFDPIKTIDEAADFIKNNGIVVDKDDLKELFATMATTKTMTIKSDSQNLTLKYIENFAKYIKASFFTEVIISEISSIDELIYEDSNFQKCIKSAISQKNKIHFMVISNANKHLINHLSSILNCSVNHLMPCQLLINNDKSIINYPKNIWTFLISDQLDINTISKKLLESSFFLAPKLKELVPNPGMITEERFISFNHFNDILYDAFSKFLLEEDAWKKIDQLEKFYKSKSNITLENIIFRQLERYSSTLLMLGVEENKIYDNLLYAKIIPLFQSSIPLTKEMIEESLNILEKIFGLENLIKTKMLFKSLQSIKE